MVSLIAGSAYAQEIVNDNPLEITNVKVSPRIIPSGSNAKLTIEVKLADGHHSYVEQFKLKAPPS